MSIEARPAATVIILRASTTGPEVLMLKRSGRAGFFPNAWVFPGGRVDPEDAQACTIGMAMGLAEADRGFGVAAIRETFEEAGVWLGEGTPTTSLRDALNQRSSTLADAPDLVADLGRLAMWAWWITPENEPKRYDTRFFIALLSAAEAEVASCDEHETVEHRWVHPRDAVDMAEAGTFFMAPPTYLTLCELADFDTGLEVMDAAVTRQVHPIMPKLDIADGQWTVVLPGDPSYPATHAVEGPTQVAFREGRWWRS
jgi:recombination protein RecT